MKDQDHIARLELHMSYSRAIGAPVETLPDKVKDAVALLLDYLPRHTANAREGVLVAAGAFLSLSLVLETDEVPPDTFAASKQRAKDLIEVVAELIISVNEASEDNDE